MYLADRYPGYYLTNKSRFLPNFIMKYPTEYDVRTHVTKC